jgi:uracil-DNA glycosylase
VVEPVSLACEDDDARRREGERLLERELEVGCVLGCRVPYDPHASRLGGVHECRGSRVEVADRDRDVQPERDSVLEPAVGGDHGGAGRHGEGCPRARGLAACDNHYDSLRHAFLRWHYPGQVLRVGGAVAALSARLARAPRYAGSIVAPGAFVDELAAARIGETFNQYAEGHRAPLLRERLGDYLARHACADVLLVGEAPGYRGARISGIPFTSERQLAGEGPAEATATIVHRVLAELGLEEQILLWNVVPTHPGTESSNRRPSRAEVASGLRFVAPLAAGRQLVAVGRLAQAVCDGLPLRHPSHGGAREFRAGLVELLDRGALAPGPA